MAQIPFPSITFLVVLMNFTFLLSTQHIVNPLLSLLPSLPLFPGNCFMVLLVAVGREPQVCGPVKGLSSTLGAKAPFSPTINSGMSQPRAIRFPSPLCLFQTLITCMDLLRYGRLLYRENIGSHGQHHVCSALSYYCFDTFQILARFSVFFL